MASATGAPYDDLADVYDLLTDGPDVGRWVRRLGRLIHRHSPAATQLLDVACGTGAAHLAFADMGFRVTGCDLSAEMLERARRRGSAARLERCDMRALPVLGRFDVATCLNDSLNHLASEDDLRATFLSVARQLGAHGLFVFDVTTPRRYEMATDSIVEASGRMVLFRGAPAADAPPDQTEVRVDVLQQGTDGRWDRRTWTHAHRCFEPVALHASYRDAGFELVERYAQAPGGELSPYADSLDLPAKVLHVLRLAGTPPREGGTNGLAPLAR